MASGRINLQANDGKVAGIVFEDGASGNVAVTVPKDGGKLAADSTVVHKTGNETIAGVKTFTSSPIVPVPTLANQAISMGNIIEKTGVKIGYGNGSGGNVTQLTNKATEVTLNKVCGGLMMSSSTLNAGQSVSFKLNNSFAVASLDTVSCNINGNSAPSGASNYRLSANMFDGYIIFTLTNVSAYNLAESIAFNYKILAGALV